MNAVNSTLEHQVSLQLPSHGTLLFKGIDAGLPDLHAWWLSMNTDHLVDFVGEGADQGYRLIQQANPGRGAWLQSHLNLSAILVLPLSSYLS